MAGSKITIEFTLKEAKILCDAIASHQPLKEDEMIAFMLYNRIRNELDKASGKS